MKKKRFLIYFSICLSLLTLLGVSFFYLRKLNALEKNIERVAYSYQVIIQTNLLEKNLQNAETSQRGYLLTESPDFLEGYLSELKNIPELLVDLDRLTGDDTFQQKNLDTLRQLINNQLVVLKSNMVNGVDDTLALARFEESNVQMNAVTRVIKNIKEHEKKVLSERTDRATENTSASKRSSFLSMVIAFCLCGIAAMCVLWFFNRNEIYRRQLEERLSQLTVLNEEIKGLTMASTHNLQEPMRKVQTIIDRLQHFSNIKDEDVNGQLNRIKEIYSRQQATNNTIIDYYNILSGVNKKENVHLRELILQLSADHGWAQQFSLELSNLKQVHGDPFQLRLLFTHLINNCIQFRHPERELLVRISELSEPQMLTDRSFYVVCISDNGIGIDDAYKERIFNLFEKIEVSAGNRQNGMGLSFCKRIMLNHDGAIFARRNQQFGTSILLYFPIST